MSKIDRFDEYLENALKLGKNKYPEAHRARHASFANSVTYLVTGASGGYGGPSMREHAVSWALSGDGYQEAGGGLVLQFPDGRIKMAGEWEYEEACAFAEPICYGILPKICKKIYELQYCCDDDPEDIKTLNNMLDEI